MSELSYSLIESKEIWEKYLLSKNPHSFLQSWNWGEVNKTLGHKIIRLGFYENSKPVGICQIILERAKRGPHFVIPAGPVMDLNNVKLAGLFVNALKELGKEEKVWFVRCRPELNDSQEARRLFKRIGFINAPMHLHGEHTLVVDLQESEAVILSRMRKNTRYAIRKSLEDGFKIDISTDPANAEILYKLQRETVERHKFVGFKKELFSDQIKKFGKDGSGALFTCKKDNTPLVSAIIIFYGDYAYYHHSGSSEKARNTNASYYTQWQVILEAKRRGMKYYDLWGIAPDENPKHRFFGVTIFKKGFGGERLDWLHAQDLPLSKLYWATYIFETLRRKVRHL